MTLLQRINGPDYCIIGKHKSKFVNSNVLHRLYNTSVLSYV
jgi:hypothetical protein